jgi:ParB family chromosome partitioning protein
MVSIKPEPVETRDIGLSGIGFAGDRLRKLRPEIVEALVKSMREVGQLQPIVVCPSPRTGYTLIAGRHRLEAARKLKWEGIRAEIVPDNGKDARLLMETDDNLAVGYLSPAERAIYATSRETLQAAKRKPKK